MSIISMSVHISPQISLTSDSKPPLFRSLNRRIDGSLVTEAALVGVGAGASPAPALAVLAAAVDAVARTTARCGTQAAAQ